MINLTMWLYQHDDVVVQWVHAAEQYVSIIFCSECVQQSKTKTAAQVPECDHDYEQDGFHACVVSPLLPVCNVIDIIQPRLYLGSSHHIFVSVNQLHHISEGSDGQSARPSPSHAKSIEKKFSAVTKTSMQHAKIERQLIKLIV